MVGEAETEPHEHIAVHVYIRPAEVRRRPIAVTVRVWNPASRAREQEAVTDVAEARDCEKRLTAAFRRIGFSPPLAATYARQVESFLIRESETLQKVLAEVRGS